VITFRYRETFRTTRTSPRAGAPTTRVLR
jgi:hypothetical protein